MLIFTARSSFELLACELLRRLMHFCLRRAERALSAKALKVNGVGGLAFTQDGNELAVGLGANLREHFVHGSERFGAEIIDLLQVAEIDDDLFKRGVQVGQGVVITGTTARLLPLE
jgi:hypothetical protein